MIEVSFPDKLIPAKHVWEKLKNFLVSAGCWPAEFEVSRSVGWRETSSGTGTMNLPSDEIARLIEERAMTGFFCHTKYSAPSAGYSLDFGQKSVLQSTFRSHIEEGAEAPANWDPFLECVLSRWPAIGAWVGRRLYTNWQGASLLDNYYESKYGKAPPATRTQVEKSIDGIGPDRVRIITSLNPGRPKELLPTVNFYPTAEMWLGPHFWTYAKCTKEEALAADFWLETRDTPHYTYFKCWPAPFTRPDGEQGRMQQRLWKLFFHEDCEWPPGSGTICDEPMYGPTELMPKPTPAGALAEPELGSHRQGR